MLVEIQQTILIAVAILSQWGMAANEELSSQILDICEMLPKDSTILEPNSCINWVKCSNTPDGSDYERGSCLMGLYFDKNARKCRPQNEVACPFESAVNNTNNSFHICLHKADGTFLAKPNSCNEFVYCRDSIAYSSRCPSDLVFDPAKQSCVYANQYDCNKKKPEATKINIKHKECQLISDAIYFADRYSCAQFHKCDSGEMKNYTCNKGTSFDYVTGRCLPYERSSCLPDKENKNPMGRICGTIKNKIIGYIPDGKTCSGYYQCANIEGSVDRNPIWNKCSDGRFFDAETLSCRDRIGVKCMHDRCEGMDNKYVNIVGDCKAYAHCQNGTQTTEGKCSNGYYFDEKSQGCTPLKINYAACS